MLAAKPITGGAAGDRTEGRLARPPGHHGQTHFGEPAEIAQQLEIVLDSLAETEAGIDDDALAAMPRASAAATRSARNARTSATTSP